jgi:hypothetical protein
VIPRQAFLSFSGGVSVAYVTVHVLPELEQQGQHLEALHGVHGVLGGSDDLIYLVVLFGFVVYYGLERYAQRAKEQAADDEPPTAVFWLHLGSFSIYNGVIGVLLFHREVPGFESLLLFGVAIGLHFLVTDYGLEMHFQQRYRQFGRWILTTALLAGAALGSAIDVSELALSVLFGFLSGGIVLNAIKEELPKERESRFWPFALGAVTYAALLLFV